MKKLSVEEKAMAYDSLFERLKDMYNNNKANVFARLVYERYFPELKESEGKKMREQVIYAINQLHVCECTKNKLLTWLERQGDITQLSEEEQNKLAKGVLTFCALSFINYLDAHKYEGKMCVSNEECEDIENAFYNSMWDRLHRYYCKYIEKQKHEEVAIEGQVRNHNFIDFDSSDTSFMIPVSNHNLKCGDKVLVKILKIE